MEIVEIFYSIEGEGIEIGRPEIFIRLAKCNLRCTWCDTKYSWDNGKTMHIDEVIQELRRYPCKNVAITGGEPLLQRQEVLELIKRLKESDYWIQLNTNGTIFDEEVFRLVDLITMDCKCPSSNMKSDFDVLKMTCDLFNPKTQFKFVISDKGDYDFTKNLLNSNSDYFWNVVFQPEWNNRNFVQKLIDLVKEDMLHGKIILQQQKYIWGTKKGV